MNFNHFTILMIAAVLFLMSLLTPPWVYEDHWNSGERSAGHHLFNHPPEVKSYDEMREIFSIPEGEPQHGFSVKKDILRLFNEWLAIFFLTIGSLFFAVNRRTALKILIGSFFITIGLFFTAIDFIFSWKDSF